MHIALINWSSRRYGGAENYLTNLIPALAQAGHAVGLWYQSGQPTERDPIVPDIRIPIWGADAMGIDESIRTLRRWSPDVLFCHGVADPALEARLLDVAPGVFFAHGYYGTCISGAKSWKAPVVRPCNRRFGWPCLLHFYPHRCGGLDPITMVKDYRRQAGRLELLHRYEFIVTHSGHMRNEYLRQGFDPDHVISIPFPVMGAEHTEAAPVTHLPSGDVCRLAFVGRMDFLKGGDFLIDALPRVADLLQRRVSVTFAGDGPQRLKWQARATQLAAADPRIAVQFPGWVEGTALDAVLNATDLLVFPSVWPEPFGLAGPEAGLRGVPVAAYATGGVPDWLEEGVNGSLAPGDPPRASELADAIVRCVQDPATYARLRQGAETHARRFTMSRHLASLVPIFERAVPARPLARREPGRSLRILVAHNVRCDRPGGMSRIMGLIHDRVEVAGHEVEYLCAENVAGSGSPRARFTFPLRVWEHARKAARAGRPYDIINVHEPISAIISTLRAGLGGARVVVTSHGVERRAWELAREERRLGRGGPGWKTRISYPLTSLWQSSLGLRMADHVICLNSEDRNYLVERFGISAERVGRMYPGAEAIYATLAASRTYVGAQRLLFAGTWRKNKGIEDFVPAFVTLAKAWPSLTLTVAGAGVPADVVRGAFPEAIRDRITCVDTSTDAATAAVYAAADLYLLPSLFEGTPLTLIEAMMSGLPIVTTDTCGMKDVIEQDRTGLLVPIRSPGAIVEATTRLLGHADERERLGRAARAAALERYTWERAAEPVLRVYERLAGMRR